MQLRNKTATVTAHQSAVHFTSEVCKQQLVRGVTTTTVDNTCLVAGGARVLEGGQRGVVGVLGVVAA